MDIRQGNEWNVGGGSGVRKWSDGEQWL